MWTYVWPESVDRDALTDRLQEPDMFRKAHGLNRADNEEGGKS